jgi:hypothetical protein
MKEIIEICCQNICLFFNHLTWNSSIFVYKYTFYVHNAIDFSLTDFSFPGILYDALRTLTSEPAVNDLQNIKYPAVKIYAYFFNCLTLNSSIFVYKYTFYVHNAIDFSLTEFSFPGILYDALRIFNWPSKY